MAHVVITALLLALLFPLQALSFTVQKFIGTTSCTSLLYPRPTDISHQTRHTPTIQMATTSRLSMLPDHASTLSDSAFLTAAVEVFDGSAIKDTVVVSTAYWDNLKVQLTLLLLGQLLSILVFVAVAAITMYASVEGINAQDFKSISSAPKLKVPPPEDDDLRGQTGTAIDLQKLWICVAIDFVGSIGELIPFWGEAADVVFAPIAAYLVQRLFGGSNVAFLIELGEEILPFTDLLPFATICWIIDTFAAQSDIAKLLQLGDYSPSLDNSRR